MEDILLVLVVFALVVCTTIMFLPEILGIVALGGIIVSSIAYIIQEENNNDEH